MKHNILVIIDAQNDFCHQDGSLTSKEAQNAVLNIEQLINTQDWDLIVVTRDTHSDNYMHTKEGISLPVPHCIENTWGWEIHESIQNKLKSKENVLKINKLTFGYNLIGNKIDNYLNISPDDEVKITVVGFCTDICVISNTLSLKAYFPFNAEITVLSNHCAGTSPVMHDYALAVMTSCQINISTERYDTV